MRSNQKMLALFLCPALVATYIQEPALNFYIKVWPENQVLLHEVYTVPYYIAYDTRKYTIIE